MKVALILATILVASTFAEPPPFTCDGNAFTCKMKELLHHGKYHATKLGDSLKDVGTAILNSALEKGSDLLTNGAQALLGTVLQHLNDEDLLGKREIAFFDKVKGHVKNGISLMKEAKESMHAAFEKAVKKLTGMIGDMTGLKAIEEDADQKIDGVVEEFNEEGKKGFFAMAKTIVGKLQEIFKEGMAQIKAKYGKKMEERAILGFDSWSDAWEAAKGQVSKVSDAVSGTLQPHLDTISETLSSLADKAKEHGGKLADAALDSFNDLKEKLSKHVDALKDHASTLGDHASNAADALKQVVTDIANQTLKNAVKTLTDAVGTGKDAVDTVVDHVSGSS